MTVTAGITTNLDFPSVYDIDGDGYTVSVNLGQASAFITGSFPNYSIKPNQSQVSAQAY